MQIEKLPLTRVQKSAQTRENIIAAARTLLRQAGYEQLTVRNVCQLADVSNGTFYHFFRSKDDLMSVFLRWEDAPVFSWEENGDLLEYIIDVYMQLLDRYFDLGLDFSTQFFTASNQAFNFRTRKGTFALDLYAQPLREAQALGYVTQNRNIDEILADMQAIVIGNIFEWGVFGGNFNVKGNLSRMLRSYLKNGVFTEAFFEKYPYKGIPMIL